MAEIAKIKGYDIRDKKLADATAQSTVASTDAIEMKTSSGDQVYITRDQFVQAVASVLNSNTKSTISQLFGADANGNHAAINMSNLASVLGINTLERRTRRQFTDMSTFISTLKSAIADQNLEKYGMRVGDYITVQHVIDGSTKSFNYIIAGLNVMKGTVSEYHLTQDHVGIIVDTSIIVNWNTTATTAGGYINSNLNTFLSTTIFPLVQTDLDAFNLYAHKKYLTNSINASGYNRFGEASGCSNGATWVEKAISALTETQVFGSTVWSSSGYDTGEGDRMLDVFEIYSPSEIFGNKYVWLRDIVSATQAAALEDYGNVSTPDANAGYYVAGLVMFA